MTPAELAEIHAACFVTPRPWRDDEFKDLLADSAVFLCARRDGFALGRLLLDEAELLTLAVRPKARRSGLGRSLLADFETLSRSGGATTAFLEVNTDNRAATALYQTSGYTEAGCRKAYYRTPAGTRIDARVFRKSLV